MMRDMPPPVDPPDHTAPAGPGLDAVRSLREAFAPASRWPRVGPRREGSVDLAVQTRAAADNSRDLPSVSQSTPRPAGCAQQSEPSGGEPFAPIRPLRRYSAIVHTRPSKQNVAGSNPRLPLHFPFRAGRPLAQAIREAHDRRQG